MYLNLVDHLCGMRDAGISPVCKRERAIANQNDPYIVVVLRRNTITDYVPRLYTK